MAKHVQFLTLLSIVLILNAFFFVEVGKIGWLLISSLFSFATLLALTPRLKTTSQWLQAGSTVLLINWMALLLSERTQPEVTFILSVGVLGGFLVLHNMATGATAQLLSSLSEVAFLPLQLVGNYLSSALAIMARASQNEEESSSATHKVAGWLKPVFAKVPVKSLLIGAVVSIPVLVMLVSLLKGADPIFAKNVDALFQFKGVEKIVERIILSVVLLGVLAPWLMPVVKKHFVSPLAKAEKFNFVTEWTVVMALVAMVLATFAWIQWRYIFVPPVKGVELSQFGIATYSEYVQKGFNEFIFLSIFIQGLLWIGLSALRTHTIKGKQRLFGVQMIVWAEAVFILLAFFRRIWLYQSFHGLTLVRMYGGFVVAWVGVMALGLLGRHFMKMQWVRFELLGTALLLIALATMNPVQYVAAVKPPTVNERVDHTYLARVSSDGVNGWIKSYQWAKEVLNSERLQQPVIDAATRRDIIYAGVVLEWTMRHRLELLAKYGNQEELLTASKEITQYSQTEVENALVEITKVKDVLDGSVPDGMVFNELELRKLTYYRETPNFDGLLRNERDLQVLRERLATDSATLASIKVEDVTGLPVYSPEYRGLQVAYHDAPQSSGQGTPFIWVNMFCSALSTCYPKDLFTSSAVPNSWFVWSGAVNIANERELDRYERNSWETLIAGNPSEQKAHQALKEEASLTELLGLQRTYFKTMSRLGQQKTEDLTVDLDLDLDAPFLQQ